jgi:hypothetical protein
MRSTPTQEIEVTASSRTTDWTSTSIPTVDADDVGQIRISCHADLRWVQRAHSFDCPLHQAWDRANTVTPKYRDFDRVRYDEKTETLLCVNGQTLVTVLSAEYETFSPRQSDKQKTTRCVACGRSRSPETDDCTHCGFRCVVDQTASVSTQEGQ